MKRVQTAGPSARRPRVARATVSRARVRVLLLSGMLLALASPLAVRQHADGSEGAAVGAPGRGRIREEVPPAYRGRYEKWKEEFLRTSFGREQWARYAGDETFTLTIRVDAGAGGGSKTGQYRWDAAGKLIGATITLGAELNKGYPEPAYYPVLSALAPTPESPYVSGEILAAAKLAHELGHVKQAASSDMTLYQLQHKLAPAYNAILRANGRDTNDPRLLELARQMGGTPLEIGEDREHRAEAEALRYLRERLPKGSAAHRHVFETIRRSVTEYAGARADRFE